MELLEKLLDSSRVRAPGWHLRIQLDRGLKQVYEW
jgi:hypothetical protein